MILLVEDDQWVADCYAQWLRAEHPVRHARSAQDALDILDEQPARLIILDLFLPHANAMQFLYTLRSHHDLAHIPVVLCSASLPDDLPDLTPYGVRATLHKADLTPQKLQEIVKREAI